MREECHLGFKKDGPHRVTKPELFNITVYARHSGDGVS